MLISSFEEVDESCDSHYFRFMDCFCILFFLLERTLSIVCVVQRDYVFSQWIFQHLWKIVEAHNSKVCEFHYVKEYGVGIKLSKRNEDMQTITNLQIDFSCRELVLGAR